MKAAILYFDVKDTEYFKRLEQFISLNYSRYLTVNKEKEKADYLVTDYLNKRNSKTIITIKDYYGDISKYQRATQICIELINQVFRDTDIPEDQNGTKPMVYCITSAKGGAGKTTVSKAIAKYSAGTGRDVLYINPDPASAGEMDMPKNSGNGITKLLYYLKTNRIKSGILLSELAQPCKTGSYDCVVNTNASPDCLLDSDFADRLMDAVLRDELHDIVIIDFPSYLADSLLNILQRADIGLIISGNASCAREQLFNQYILSKSKDNIIVINNRCTTGEYFLPSDNSSDSGEFYSALVKIIKKAENIDDY